MRKIWFVGLVTIAAVVTAVPAGAISYGAPDGTAHPAVGSLVVRTPDRVFQVCTGTLVAPRVFLTAAHCLFGLESLPLEVTFDPVIDSAGTFYGGHGVVHPSYTDYRGAGGLSDPRDVAVFVLDRAPGITSVPVAPIGALDRRAVRGLPILTVGYGTVRHSRTTGSQGMLDNLARNQGTGSGVTLTAAWLKISMNQAKGDAGTCFGDSGGPHLVDGVIVAITAIGDNQCKAMDTTYRVDTPLVHAFLDPYLGS